LTGSMAGMYTSLHGAAGSGSATRSFRCNVIASILSLYGRLGLAQRPLLQIPHWPLLQIPQLQTPLRQHPEWQTPLRHHHRKWDFNLEVHQQYVKQRTKLFVRSQNVNLRCEVLICRLRLGFGQAQLQLYRLVVLFVLGATNDHI